MDYRRNYIYQRNRRLTEAEDDFDELAKKYGLRRTGDGWALTLDYDDIAELLTLHTSDFAQSDGIERIVAEYLKNGSVNFHDEQMLEWITTFAWYLVNEAGYDDSEIEGLLTDKNLELYMSGVGDIYTALSMCEAYRIDDVISGYLWEAFDDVLNCSNKYISGLKYEATSDGIVVYYTPLQADFLMNSLDSPTSESFSGQLKDKRLSNLYQRWEQYIIRTVKEYEPWEWCMLNDIENDLDDPEDCIGRDEFNDEFRKTINTNESYRRRYGRRIYEGRSIYHRTPSTSRRYAHRR